MNDFALVVTGTIEGQTITQVAGSGTSYIVTVQFASGTGTIGLNLVDNDSIVDLVGNPLGGTGLGNGNLIGATYTIVAAT